MHSLPVVKRLSAQKRFPSLILKDSSVEFSSRKWPGGVFGFVFHFLSGNILPMCRKIKIIFSHILLSCNLKAKTIMLMAQDVSISYLFDIKYVLSTKGGVG